MPTLPKPTYDIWQAIAAALELATKAIEEVRALAREPGPAGEKGDPGMAGTNGKDGVGKDGRDGADGVGFDSMTEELAEDGRTIIRRYVRGDQQKEFRHRFPVMIYRGVWKQSKYMHGDTVTQQGSMFVALRDTEAKPGESSDWQLATKRGQDGRDGKDGTPPPRGTIPFGDK